MEQSTSDCTEHSPPFLDPFLELLTKHPHAAPLTRQTAPVSVTHNSAEEKDTAGAPVATWTQQKAAGGRGKGT